MLFDVFGRGDFRGNVQAQSTLLLGERFAERRDQRGVLAGTRCFALQDLLATEGSVLLEVRLELKRGRVRAPCSRAARKAFLLAARWEASSRLALLVRRPWRQSAASGEIRMALDLETATLESTWSARLRYPCIWRGQRNFSAALA